MKKTYILLSLLLLIPLVKINATPVNTEFIDDNFYECIIKELNTSSINSKTDRDIFWIVTDSELSQLTQKQIEIFFG